MGLIARGIEEQGISTTFVGLMRDVMRLNRPPRAAFLDFPMAHPFGRPLDRLRQLAILREVLGLLESAQESGTLVELPYAWGETFSYLPRVRRLPSKGDPPAQG